MLGENAQVDLSNGHLIVRDTGRDGIAASTQLVAGWRGSVAAGSSAITARAASDLGNSRRHRTIEQAGKDHLGAKPVGLAERLLSTE